MNSTRSGRLRARDHRAEGRDLRAARTGSSGALSPDREVRAVTNDQLPRKMAQPLPGCDPHRGTPRVGQRLAEPPLIAIKEIEELLTQITKRRRAKNPLRYRILGISVFDNLDQAVDRRPVEAASPQPTATTEAKLRVAGTLLKDLQLELLDHRTPRFSCQSPGGVRRAKAISSCFWSTPDRSTWLPSSSRILTLTPSGRRPCHQSQIVLAVPTPLNTSPIMAITRSADRSTSTGETLFPG